MKKGLVVHIYQTGGEVMGGPWQIKCRLPSAFNLNPQIIHQIAFNALHKIEQQMSHFKSDSDLARVNNAPIGEWIEIPDLFYQVLQVAKEMFFYTKGAVNVGLGKVINQWGFGVEKSIDINNLSDNNFSNQDLGFEINNGMIKKNRSIMLNLSCIAKGFAVDYACICLKKIGLTDFMVEAAGDIYAMGEKSPNVAWQIGLELPLPKKSLVYDVISLKNQAVAGSGGYRKYREINGKTYSHTFNPQTGAPIEGDLLSVMVRDDLCARADVLATGLYVMGVKNGSEFAEKQQIPALFLIKIPEGICELSSKYW